MNLIVPCSFYVVFLLPLYFIFKIIIILHPFFSFFLFCWPVPQLLSPWYISLRGVQRTSVELPNWSEKAGSTERTSSQIFPFINHICLDWMAEYGNCGGRKTSQLGNWKKITSLKSVKSICLMWSINLIDDCFFFLIMILRRGRDFAIMEIFCFWKTLEAHITFIPVFLLQSLKCIGLRFLFPWAKANCYTEWTVNSFLSLYKEIWGLLFIFCHSICNKNFSDGKKNASLLALPNWSKKNWQH